MSYFRQNQQRGHFFCYCDQLYKIFFWPYSSITHNKLYLFKEEISPKFILTQLRPSLSPALCIIWWWLWSSRVLVIFASPSSSSSAPVGGRVDAQPAALQHCSTAALQTLATCSLQCCSAGSEYTQTLRSAARLLLQSTLSHCTPTAALQHVLRTHTFAWEETCLCTSVIWCLWKLVQAATSPAALCCNPLGFLLVRSSRSFVLPEWKVSGMHFSN